MFEELDDLEPFDPNGAFRSKVTTRANGLRRRRRTRRLAVGCGALASASAVLVAVRPNSGDDRIEVSTGRMPGGATSSGPAATSSTEPVASADLRSENYLLTGSDSRECIDPTGERSDTIMVLRVEPATRQAAVLSFPRDLWVSVAGSNKTSRISETFDPQNPKQLIDTIWENFLIPVDHYVNVDFCAFKDIVDAIGGIAVPFEYAARDRNTGLDIAVPECHTFGGDEALAYVRSRHYEYLDPATNGWITDPTSDLGRITRQQDFLQRAIRKAIDASLGNPAVLMDLVQTFKNRATTDTGMTVDAMVDLAMAMQGLDAAGLRTFQIEGQGVVKGNAQVLEPVLDTENMQLVLAAFRGASDLSDATTASIGVFPPDDPNCH